MTSINTNAAAQIALQTLRGINSELNTLNDQISTGRKVNNARDNASVFAISQTIQSDINSYKTLTDSLNLGSSTVGVARSASESIVNLLKDAKTQISSAQAENVDRSKIQTELTAINDQIQSIVDSASFNGLNLLKGGDALSILSSFNRTDATTVSSGTIAVAAQNLATSNLELGSTADGGQFSAVGATGVATLATSDSDVTVADTTPDNENLATDGGTAISDSETITVQFAANRTIEAGDTYQLQFTVAGESTARTAVFVAQEGATAKDVIDSLAEQVRDFGVNGLSVQTTTSDLASAVNNLVITNGTGGDITSTSLRQTNDNLAGDVQAQGTLAAFAAIDVTTDQGAADALAAIDGLIDFAVNAAAAFGSAQNRIDTQLEFNQSLIDNLELGNSALVDADLSAASARLTALQVQQQLGLQSLSIANQAPQSILSLFR